MSECSICLKQIDNEDAHVKTECNHVFCYGCFIRHFTSGWVFSSKCPNCRSPLDQFTSMNDLHSQTTNPTPNPLIELLDLPGIGSNESAESYIYQLDQHTDMSGSNANVVDANVVDANVVDADTSVSTSGGINVNVAIANFDADFDADLDADLDADVDTDTDDSWDTEYAAVYDQDDMERQRFERRVAISARRTLNTMNDLDVWVEDILRQWQQFDDI